MPEKNVYTSWYSTCISQHTDLNQKDRIDTSVEFWWIRYLGVLSPHDLAALRHEAEVAHIDLNDCTLRDDPQLCDCRCITTCVQDERVGQI